MKLRPTNDNSWWGKWRWGCIFTAIGALLGCLLFWVLFICAVAGVFS